MWIPKSAFCDGPGTILKILKIATHKPTYFSYPKFKIQTQLGKKEARQYASTLLVFLLSDIEVSILIFDVLQIEQKALYIRSGSQTGIQKHTIIDKI